MSNEWQITKGDWRNSNPLGKKINDFILQDPEWAIYLRKEHRFPCPQHYDHSTETAKTFELVDCTCMGFGVKTIAQIIPCKISRGKNAEVDPQGGIARDLPGYLAMFSDVVHFPKGAYPRNQDIVMTAEWDVPISKIKAHAPSPRPVRIGSIYIIKIINAYYQRELSHFSCGMENLEIESDMADNLIPKMLTNLPVMEVDTVWQQNSYW